VLDRPVVLGSRCGRRMCSTHAGASSGPPRNEFQQVETRAGGPRPRHARIVQVPSRGPSLASPFYLFLHPSILTTRSFIVSAVDLLSSVTRGS